MKSIRISLDGQEYTTKIHPPCLGEKIMVHRPFFLRVYCDQHDRRRIICHHVCVCITMDPPFFFNQYMGSNSILLRDRHGVISIIQMVGRVNTRPIPKCTYIHLRLVRGGGGRRQVIIMMFSFSSVDKRRIFNMVILIIFNYSGLFAFWNSVVVGTQYRGQVATTEVLGFCTSWVYLHLFFFKKRML